MTTAQIEKQALFVDRDGTLIQDERYLDDASKVKFFADVMHVLGTLRELGLLLVLVSNQSGIGRGYIKDTQYERVHREIVSKMANNGVCFDAAYYCPHAPQDNCNCRKPSPGMLLQAAKELGIDLERSFMIGDKLSDVEAGQRAGCQTILFGRSHDGTRGSIIPDYVATTWADVSQFITGELGVS